MPPSTFTRIRTTSAQLAADVGPLLALVWSVPVVILAIGAPIALAIKLVLFLAARLQRW